VGDMEWIGDVVKTASGELFEGADQSTGGELDSDVCCQCGDSFEYKPVLWWDGTRSPYQPSLCARCTEEAEKARAFEEKRQHYEMSSFYRLRDDRGSRLGQASLAAFEQGAHNAAALKAATAWLAEERKPNLIIVGPIGSGKSYLAACLYNALHAHWEPAYWLNAGSLMAQIRRGFSDRDAAAEAGERMELAERAPYLVLDDLGKVHPGKDVSWVEETFYSIVEARYRNELPTIVTTEWKSAALAERVGMSVVSRLEDGAWVAGIKKPAEAYRKTAA